MVLLLLDRQLGLYLEKGRIEKMQEKIEEIKKQQELEQEGVKFLEKSVSSPLEFFLEVKGLMLKNGNKVLVKQYVYEKL